MKQFMLLGGFLLSVSVALAQSPNRATTTQAGNQQVSTQLQSGSSLTATITQTTGTSGSANTGNLAKTDQTGEAQGAVIDQIDAFSSAAGITQTGNGNMASITQIEVSTSNTATIGQYGNDNGVGNHPLSPGSTSIFQGMNAVGNSGTITQGDPRTNATNNSAQLYQYDGASGNTAVINQLSNGNAAVVTQATAASDNAAQVDQSVGSSYGEISQIGQATSNSATVTQSADLNLGRIYQQGAAIGSDESYRNTANLTQSGDDNEAAIYQLGTNGDSHDNKATIRQSGSGNNSFATVFSQPGGAVINQGTQEAGSGNAHHNEATIQQAGKGNGAIINQYDNSFYNTASIQQDGASSYAIIDQLTQSGNNKASITQGEKGADNQAYVRQQNTDNAGGLTTTKNSVDLEQNTTKGGSNNSIRVVQGYGVDFAGPSTTLSVGNTITGSQQGDGNDALLGQGGSTNKATFSQTGSDNVLYNANSDGTPGNTFAPMTGTGNTLNVNQVNEITTGKATSNAAYINISGNNNTAIVNQTISGILP